MKAFVVDRYKSKDGGRLGDMPEPEVRDDDVLVEVHAASVNQLDSKIRNGEFKLILPYRLPLILGNDVAGVVIRWQVVDPQTVDASFTNASHTIHATLSFNERGELTNFVADGRGAATADGKSFTRMRWSTPLGSYRAFGSHQLMARGEGVWHPPAGDYSYLRFDLDAIEYNVAGPRGQQQ